MKFLSFSVFTIVVAVSQKIETALIGFLIALAVSVLAHLNPILLIKRILIANFFIILLWFFLPFTQKGEPLFHILGLTASKQGVDLSFLITLKCNAILLATLSLLTTSPLISLGSALSQLKLPKKIIHLFFFSVRYLFTFHEEYLRIRNALRARCFRPKTNLHTYRTFAYLVGTLVVNSFERSERVLSAMKCRGFKGEFHSLEQPRLRINDIVLLFLFALLSAFLGAVEWKPVIF